ncbi:MAG: hypothetical protein H7Z74_15425, partial [Anaerolineae bacterium]|nr:hypothetical protein [Gemmatimonadaceae bacterium]
MQCGVVDDVWVARARPSAGGTRRARAGTPRGSAVCAPPDQEFAELLAGVGVPLVPIGQPIGLPVTKSTRPSAADLSPRAAE